MVRSALFQSNSPSRPDPVRIIAISIAIALNAGFFALMLRPPEFAPPLASTDDRIPLTFVTPTPKPIELVSKPIVKHEQRPVLNHPVVAPIVHRTQPPVISNTLTPVSTDFVAQPTDTKAVDTTIAPTQPVETSLDPIAAPAPTYPISALRDGITGTVELELLVGTDGRVLDVQITHSSGNRELDRAAREQVLRSWRFQPAMRNGIAVQSLGRVPIVFSLDQN